MPACSACIEQTSRGRHEDAHPALRLERETSYETMYGLTNHAVYKCSQCGTAIHRLSDKTCDSPYGLLLK